MREQEQRAKQKRGDGYEINIGDDVINEALRSVDRIREQVSSTPAGAADDDDGLAIPLAVEHVAEPEKEVEPPPPPLPAEDDDFGLRFDQEPADEFAPAPDAADEDGEFAWEADDGGDNLAQAYTAGSADLDLDQYSTPEDLLKQSVYLMDENRFEEAEKYLEKALDLDANFSEAIPYLGWCVYNRSGGSEAQRAEQIIKDGIQKSPKMYQSFLYLGKIYRAEKQPDFAELHFVKALELNVDCMEAKEEIKKIHQR
ncbi:MAG: hypothetical protein M5R36_16795 [Deltaproteobacteria bacterium]|nr:hypothetical protein [Deltaproteobacteria bacterium]